MVGNDLAHKGERGREWQETSWKKKQQGYSGHKERGFLLITMASHWKSGHWEETCNQCLKKIGETLWEQIREGKDTNRALAQWRGHVRAQHRTEEGTQVMAQRRRMQPCYQLHGSGWWWRKGKRVTREEEADARLPLGMWYYLKPICLLQEIRKRWQSPAASVESQVFEVFSTWTRVL